MRAMPTVTRRIVVPLLLVLWPTLVAASEEVPWRSIVPGLEQRETRHSLAGVRQPIELTVLRADPAEVRFAVLDTYSMVSTRGVKYPSYSLRDLVRVTDALALINGGFGQSTYYPVPAGLVLQDGRQKSRLNSKSRTQSGLFCVLEEGALARAGTGPARIVDKLDYSAGLCRQALQSGPKIVEYPGENGISQPKRAFIRSVVCIDEGGRVLFVRSSRVTLYHLAEILRAPDERGGYGCQAALNLSGDIESGLLYRDGERMQQVGEIDAPVASAIAILPKRAE